MLHATVKSHRTSDRSLAEGLALLATEIFRLSQFHPASSFICSRLPMPLHYADRMSKEAQSLGQVGVFHNVDRQKIFAA